MRRALIAASGMVAVMASLLVHAAPLTDEKPLPEGRAVVLRIEAGEVVVEPGDPGRVGVEVDLLPGQRLLWREGLDRLIVVLDDSVRTVPRPSRLRLRVPPTADLVLRVGNSSLDVSGVGGQRLRVEAGRSDVVVASAAPDIAIETTQGAIEARSDGGRLATNSVSGRQRLQASGAVEVEASSVGGSIEAQLAVGARVRLASVAGGIRLQVGAGSGVDAHLETLSGDIELRLPPGTPFGVRLAPSSGTVELPPTYVPRADGLWTSAPGGGVARLISFSGNIRVIEPPPRADTP